MITKMTEYDGKTLREIVALNLTKEELQHIELSFHADSLKSILPYFIRHWESAQFDGTKLIGKAEVEKYRGKHTIGKKVIEDKFLALWNEGKKIDNVLLETSPIFCTNPKYAVGNKVLVAYGNGQMTGKDLPSDQTIDGLRKAFSKEAIEPKTK